MYRKPSKRQHLIKMTVIYSLMSISVIALVTFITMYMLGYRFTTDNGIEQYALLQFNSSPSGATVSLNGDVVSSKTPNKASVAAGTYEVVIWRDGYETWKKTVTVAPGSLTWLNYALLVPEELKAESIQSYDSLYDSLASPDYESILLQEKSDSPKFTLVDVSSDKTPMADLVLPATSYGQGNNSIYSMYGWDSAGRYMLLKHTYSDDVEWLLLDTQDVDSTINITSLLDISISDICFYDTGGNKFYILTGNDIRQIDLSKETISKVLVSGVSDFEYYEDSSVITYTGSSTSDSSAEVFGVYRSNEDSSVEVFDISEGADKTNIITAEYFSENYIVTTEDNLVTILNGSYPSVGADNANSLKEFTSFELDWSVDEIMFSPSGQYLLMRSGTELATYDLEYQTLSEFTIEGSGDNYSVKWLDENHIWSDYGGSITIRDYDGANIYTICLVSAGQDAVLTKNGRYLYSVEKTTNGYQLQRVRMMLP